jgi:galactokinase
MSDIDLIQTSANLFRSLFPEVVGHPLVYGIAPGRVEILGNHTDYNEGFVLSAAIDKYTVVTGCAVDGETVKIYSDRMAQIVEFSIKDTTPFPKESQNTWANYLRGVMLAMNPPSGFCAVVASTVPVGAGLSSSAALELATAEFLQGLFPEHPLSLLAKMDVVLLCKKAENDFVGMGCGILDQYTSMFGKAGQLLVPDCRHLDNVSTVPVPPGYKFVVVESDAPHQLVDGKYNELRAKCFEAAGILGKRMLRDVSPEELAENMESLPEDLQGIASHIVHENSRVLKAVEILAGTQDMKSFGELLSQSHESSRVDFKNSCPEIDTLIQCANGLPGFLGGRIQGGGFGGSTINLVDSSMVEMFQDLVTRAYFEKTGISGPCFAVEPAKGASRGNI